jgi:hypothetical protein
MTNKATTLLSLVALGARSGEMKGVVHAEGESPGHDLHGGREGEKNTATTDRGVALSIVEAARLQQQHNSKHMWATYGHRVKSVPLSTLSELEDGWSGSDIFASQIAGRNGSADLLSAAPVAARVEAAHAEACKIDKRAALEEQSSPVEPQKCRKSLGCSRTDPFLGRLVRAGVESPRLVAARTREIQQTLARRRKREAKRDLVDFCRRSGPNVFAQGIVEEMGPPRELVVAMKRWEHIHLHDDDDASRSNSRRYLRVSTKDREDALQRKLHSSRGAKLLDAIAMHDNHLHEPAQAKIRAKGDAELWARAFGRKTKKGLRARRALETKPATVSIGILTGTASDARLYAPLPLAQRFLHALFLASPHLPKPRGACSVRNFCTAAWSDSKLSFLIFWSHARVSLARVLPALAAYVLANLSPTPILPFLSPPKLLKPSLPPALARSSILVTREEGPSMGCPNSSAATSHGK